MIITTIVLMSSLIAIMLLIAGFFTENDFAFILGLVSLIFIVIIITPVIIDGLEYEHYRAENAQQQCLSRGFDNYITYSGMFRKVAYGVTCKYQTDSDEAVPIILNNR